MKLKCQCCDFEQEFTNAEDAYNKGWDCPPYFTGFVCCHLCPAVCVVMRLSHAKAHAHWAEKGRPEKFGNDCVPDLSWGQSQLEYESQIAGGKAIADSIIGKGKEDA